MFSHNGNVLKLVEIEGQGRYEGEYLCYYEYKEECEPEVNKLKYPNPEDRWYENYMNQRQILQAINGGAEFIDTKNEFIVYSCEHEWDEFGFDNISCNKCGINKQVLEW